MPALTVPNLTSALRLLVLLLLTVAAATSAHCQTVKPTYMLYLVQFEKDTLLIKMSERQPGQVIKSNVPVEPVCTVITVLDYYGKAIYQTTLPLIPERGEVYPVMVPVDDDNYTLVAEGVKDKFRFKRLGRTQLNL